MNRERQQRKMEEIREISVRASHASCRRKRMATGKSAFVGSSNLIHISRARIDLNIHDSDALPRLHTIKLCTTFTRRIMIKNSQETTNFIHFSVLFLSFMEGSSDGAGKGIYSLFVLLEIATDAPNIRLSAHFEYHY